MCKFVRFQHLAVKHWHYACPLAREKHLFQRRNRSALGGVGRFQDIIATQVVEKQGVDTHGLAYLGIVGSIPHGTVDGSVVHHHHFLVEGVLDIEFYYRIAVTGGHFDAVCTVFRDEIFAGVRFPEPAAAVGGIEALLRKCRRRAGLK